VLLVLASAGTDEAARPRLLLLAPALLLWVLVSGLALCLWKRSGRAVAASVKENKGVRALRVSGGQAGNRLPQTAGEDRLLIRTTGVADVFRELDGPEPLTVEETVAGDLRPSDLVLVLAGQVIPCDGEVVEGAAAIDEATVTGVSWPVFREAGGTNSGVLGGTLVISGRVLVRVAA
jgi:high-affinity K+ transport system ATPase subunit B